MREPEECCVSCAFYDEVSSTCRISPPVAFSEKGQGCWPEVDNDEWCGGHTTDEKIKGLAQMVVLDRLVGVGDVEH